MAEAPATETAMRGADPVDDPDQLAGAPMLRWVSTRSAALGAVGAGGAILAERPLVALGIGVGALVAVANFWALRYLAARLFTGDARTKGMAMVLFSVKFVALATVVWVLLSTVRMDAVGFMVGISVVVLVSTLAPVLGPRASSGPTTSERSGEDAARGGS